VSQGLWLILTAAELLGQHVHYRALASQGFVALVDRRLFKISQNFSLKISKFLKISQNFSKK